MAHYAKGLKNGTVVLMKDSKPVAALVSLPAGSDLESLSLSENPEFLALLERSRAGVRDKGGIPLEEVRRRLGVQKASPRKRPRK